MSRLLRIIHGYLYNLFLPILVHPPGKQTASGFYTYHRLNLMRFLVVHSENIYGRVLDVGAGTWSYPRKLFGSQCQYIAVDSVKHSNIDVICDIHLLNTTFAIMSFDFILCIDVIEHVSKPWEAVIQMYDVLKIGGALLLTSPFNYPLHGNDVVRDYWRVSADGLCSLLLDHAKFSKLDIQTFGPPKYPFTITAVARK
jgi:SAM-dependent methyltransferase